MEAKDEAICPKSGSIDTGVFDVGNHFLVLFGHAFVDLFSRLKRL